MGIKPPQVIIKNLKNRRGSATKDDVINLNVNSSETRSPLFPRSLYLIYSNHEHYVTYKIEGLQIIQIPHQQSVEGRYSHGQQLAAKLVGCCRFVLSYES